MTDTRRRAALAAALAVIAGSATGCVFAGGNDAVGRAAASSDEVLVPDDERFAATWEFTLEGAPDNYTVRSNWSPSFDAEVDAALVVVGYQIGDPATWNGEAGDDDAQRAAFRAVLADSLPSATGGVCETVHDDPVISACRYDVGQVDPLSLLVRRFGDDANPIAVVVIETPAALDYLSGTFTAVPVDEAAERWLT